MRLQDIQEARYHRNIDYVRWVRNLADEGIVEEQFQDIPIEQFDEVLDQFTQAFGKPEDHSTKAWPHYLFQDVQGTTGYKVAVELYQYTMDDIIKLSSPRIGVIAVTP